jgi:uncharacterized protein (DUF488 family)
MSGSVVYTIGHSIRPVQELIILLRERDVNCLVDVRTVPRSRRNPQFNKEALPGPLRGAGIEYRHVPALGGLRHPRPDSVNTGWRNTSFRGYADYMQTKAFSESLAEVVDLARERSCALMCAESVPWRCHRSLIADALTIRGVEVMHILGRQQLKPHVLTSFARVRGTEITYPPGSA